MKKKLYRVLIVALIGLFAFFAVYNHVGRELEILKVDEVGLMHLSGSSYSTEKRYYIWLENMAAYFYGYVDNVEEPEVIYVITDTNKGYLVLQLDYDDYYKKVRDWGQYLHYHNIQEKSPEIGSLTGSLKEMTPEMYDFIMETQSEYLTLNEEREIFRYIFVADHIGDFTFAELNSWNYVLWSIPLVTGFLGLLLLLFPLGKRKAVATAEDESS